MAPWLCTQSRQVLHLFFFFFQVNRVWAVCVWCWAQNKLKTTFITISNCFQFRIMGLRSSLLHFGTTSLSGEQPAIRCKMPNAVFASSGAKCGPTRGKQRYLQAQSSFEQENLALHNWPSRSQARVARTIWVDSRT